MHRFFRALPMLALGGALGATVAVPLAQQAVLYGDTPPAGAWSPCFGNPVGGDARIVASFQRWAEVAQREHGIDPSDTEVDVVPVGMHQGLWILPGCVAIEGLGGAITFWRYTGPADLATWQPHPRMEERRAKEAEKAAFRAEVDAKVREIEAYMDANDGAMPPAQP